VIIVAVEKQINITYSECVSAALSVQHAMLMPHNVICGLSGSTIFFPHYLINGAIFQSSYWTQNVCFDFLYNFSVKFLILRRTERDIIIRVQWSSCKGSFILLMMLEFSQQIFEKYSNIKFTDKWSSRSRVIQHGRTDRHDKANSRFSQFCERAF
jgi:hypothetical protein